MKIDGKKIADLTAEDLHRMLKQVGNTPMRSVRVEMNGMIRSVHLKMESANPTGSMKDRTGYSLIRYLEEQNILNKESIVIESTSGNLGVALAFQCKARGYRFVAVIDPKTTPENIAKMEAFGARLETVHQADISGGYLLSRLTRVQELCAQHDSYIWTDQYSSPANPLIHYSSTALEIYQQMNEKVDAVFIPVSTGGTLAGIGRFFREVSPMTQIIGVDAYGSAVFGTPTAPRKLTGIGSSRRSSFISDELYDIHMLVRDEEAFEFCHALYAATKLKVGGSSGAVFAACIRYLSENSDIERVVCLCADSGDNYASSIFNSQWIKQNSINLSEGYANRVASIKL